jgi:purine-cytosine permease-like protein
MNQNWKELTIVQVGGSICLPVLMVGQILTQGYSPLSALLAIIAGNLILFCMACVTAFAGATQKKSTAEFAVDFFGDQGKLFFVGAMVVSMMGWFAIQLSLMGICAHEWLLSIGITLDKTACNFLLGSLIALVGLGGLKRVTHLANIISPLLALTILFALLQPGNSISSMTGFNFSGISLVVAGSIGAVIDLPTFFKEAKSPQDALKAAFILFCVALPLIEGAGAYLYLLHQGDNIAELLQGLSDHPFWNQWILIFLILAGWTTNNANMYSAGVSLNSLLPAVDLKYCILCVCLGGIALASLPILQNLEVVIGFIGVLLSSIGAVMISHLVMRREPLNSKECLGNICSVGIGTAIGLAALAQWITFLEIPLLEAFLSTLLLQLLFRNCVYETNLS